MTNTVCAVFMGRIFIAQFSAWEDAEAFVRLYTCKEVPLHLVYQPENTGYILYDELPEDGLCRHIIGIRTGVRL